MSNLSVKRMAFLPGGTVVRECHDDAEVKALAIRLGVYAEMTRMLPHDVPHPASAAFRRDGDTLHAILLLTGWDEPKDNGWVALSASPASPVAAAQLEQIVRRIFVGTPSCRFQEGGSWRN
ncbi:MAG: hypothetical protein IAE97_06880 [Chthoniobacterales bacterium]|nr:hypothetical protein [Chthoniobacterales bacterium]